MDPIAACVPAGAPTIDPSPNGGGRIEDGLTHVALDSPHSGTSDPHDLRHAYDARLLRQGEDTFIESPWGFSPALGGSLIHALRPRSTIGVNRTVDAIDASTLDLLRLGVQRQGDPVRLGADPLWQALDNSARLFDHAGSVSKVHTSVDRSWMPRHGPPTRTIDGPSRRQRQQIRLIRRAMASSAAAFSTECLGVACHDGVPGDQDGIAVDPWLTGASDRFLGDRGWSVANGERYAGVRIVRRSGRLQTGRRSIPVERNRGLGADAPTLARHAGIRRCATPGAP